MRRKTKKSPERLLKEQRARQAMTTQAISLGCFEHFGDGREGYRGFLNHWWGVDSSTEMNDTQLKQLFLWLKYFTAGWKEPDMNPHGQLTRPQEKALDSLLLRMGSTEFYQLMDLTLGNTKIISELTKEEAHDMLAASKRTMNFNKSRRQ